MNKRIISGLCGAALLLVSAVSAPSPASADPLSLFVRKTQLSSTEKSGKVYAPASDLLKAMGFQWTVDGTTVKLSQGAAGGPSLSPAKGYAFVLPNGKSVTVDTIAVKKDTWILVRPLAEAAGGTYIATPAAGIVQIVFPTTAISQKDLERAVRDSKHQEGVDAPPLTGDSGDSGSAEKSSESGDKTADAGDKKPADNGGEAAGEEKKEEVIKVTSLDFSNPIIPGSKVPAELRGTATIKNTSDKRVTNVKFTVELRDLGDNPVTTLPTKFISAMEPGETASQDFLWYNYYNQTITPKVKIEHDPLPTPKKKTESKEGESGEGTKTDAAPSGGK